jgi:putative transposase
MRIDHYMHTASRHLIDLLVSEGIGTLVIGKNPGWKQEASMSRRNNQHFVQIAHARLITMLTYKAQLVRINVILQKESYTSKASFLDLDPIPVYSKEEEEKPAFSGRRIKRGIYKSQSGQTLNSDINGSYNIMRKALPNVFTDNRIGDANKTLASLVVHPVRIVVPIRTRVHGHFCH